MEELTSRRVVIGGAIAAAAGVAGYIVALRSGLNQPKAATAAANGYGPPAAASGQILAHADQVPPQGGGLILTQDLVVLVREPGGSIKAFSATCTHQGCTVSSVSEGRIMCPCHGSVFSATTGAVVSGPAPRSLPGIDIVVRRGDVFRA
jgi:Rieske Fe-S protein